MKRNVLILILVGVISLWSVDRAYSAIRCVSLSPLLPFCFDTIQDAVNAANPGDIIVITPNPDPRGYRENVDVSTSNLTIVGVDLSLIIRDGFDCSKVIVDGCQTADDPTDCGVNTDNGDGFTIGADGVTIKNLTIRHFRDGVELLSGADSTTIINVCFIDNRDGVHANDNPPHNNVKVLKSQFTNQTDKGIRIRGNDAQVNENLLQNTDDEAIVIRGLRAKIIKNTIRVTDSDDDCIDISEDQNSNAQITHNYIDSCDGHCINYDGDNSNISFNTIKNCDDKGIEAEINLSDGSNDNNKIENNLIESASEQAVRISGSNNKIAFNNMKSLPGGQGIEYNGNNPDIYKNTINGTAEQGIRLFCFTGDSFDGSTCTGGSVKENNIQNVYQNSQGMEIDGFNLRIEYNITMMTGQEGIHYDGDFGNINFNKVERAGSEPGEHPGIEIMGDMNNVNNNTVRFAGTGIRNIDGSENTYTGNLCEKNARSGIIIEEGSDNIVDRNRTLNNNGEGINNADTATDTDVTNNTSTGNRTDICNDGSIDAFTGNFFITGGTGTDCVVEQ